MGSTFQRDLAAVNSYFDMQIISFEMDVSMSHFTTFLKYRYWCHHITFCDSESFLGNLSFLSNIKGQNVDSRSVGGQMCRLMRTCGCYFTVFVVWKSIFLIKTPFSCQTEKKHSSIWIILETILAWKILTRSHDPRTTLAHVT